MIDWSKQKDSRFRLKVLLPQALPKKEDDDSFVNKLAKACYQYTMVQKEAFALARTAENAIQAVQAITALLPS